MRVSILLPGIDQQRLTAQVKGHPRAELDKRFYAGIPFEPYRDEGGRIRRGMLPQSVDLPVNHSTTLQNRSTQFFLCVLLLFVSEWGNVCAPVCVCEKKITKEMNE